MNVAGEENRIGVGLALLSRSGGVVLVRASLMRASLFGCSVELKFDLV